MNKIPSITYCSRAALHLMVGLVGFGLPQFAQGEPIQSVGPMTFVDANTLVVADWRAGQLHALKLSPVSERSPGSFNLTDISTPIANALHTEPDKLRFEGLAFRPGTELAYVTLSVNRGDSTPEPAMVVVNSTGEVLVVDLITIPRTSVEVSDRPGPDKFFWRDVPQATLTVTDLAYYDGKLYVAGLSNESFASCLRVYDFPFNGNARTTSIEMYHAVHNQIETRAPIRKMVIVSLNGEPTLVAAYTCTPLVTIPLKDLKDGAHITGKTIAELGWGSAPVDLVAFDAGQGPVVLLVNSNKAADLMTIPAIADAASKAALNSPIKWPSAPMLGVASTYIPIAGIAHLGNQDQNFLGALRRNELSGDMELVSIRKGAFLRLRDYVVEYDFADYRYGPNDTWHPVHQLLRTDEGYPDLAKRATLP